MKNRTLAGIAAGLWISAIGCAALAYSFDHRAPTSRAPSFDTAMRADSNLHPADDEAPVDTEVVMMPVETITPQLLPSGVTEMQAGTQLVIGPGVVTHPASIPPAP